MTAEQKQAYEWAKNQTFQSVAARYAKILAELVDELTADRDTSPETEKNEPLTLEELRQMDGEPVWVEPLGAACGSGEAWKRYGIINGEKVDVPGVDYWHWWLKHYGKEWLAYRRKPKEET